MFLINLFILWHFILLLGIILHMLHYCFGHLAILFHLFIQRNDCMNSTGKIKYVQKKVQQSGFTGLNHPRVQGKMKWNYLSQNHKTVKFDSIPNRIDRQECIGAGSP